MLQLSLNDLKESKLPKAGLDNLNQKLERPSPFCFCRKYLSLLQSSSVRLAQSWDFSKFVLGALSTFLLLFRGEDGLVSVLVIAGEEVTACHGFCFFFFLYKGFQRGEDFNDGVSEKFLCMYCFFWATYSS